MVENQCQDLVVMYRSGALGFWAWPWLGEKERPVAVSKGTPGSKACAQREYDGEVFGLGDRTISGTSSPAMRTIKFAKLFPCAGIALIALHVTFYLICTTYLLR